jgi:hypothetical protein
MFLVPIFIAIWLLAFALMVLPPSLALPLFLFPGSRVIARRVLRGYVTAVVAAAGYLFIAAFGTTALCMAIWGSERYRHDNGLVGLSAVVWVCAGFGGFAHGFIHGWRYEALRASRFNAAPPTGGPPPLPSRRLEG